MFERMPRTPLKEIGASAPKIPGPELTRPVLADTAETPVELTGFHRPQIDGVLCGQDDEALREGRFEAWAHCQERSVAVRPADGTALEVIDFRSEDTSDIIENIDRARRDLVR